MQIQHSWGNTRLKTPFYKESLVVKVISSWFWHVWHTQSYKTLSHSFIFWCFYLNDNDSIWKSSPPLKYPTNLSHIKEVDHEEEHLNTNSQLSGTHATYNLLLNQTHKFCNDWSKGNTHAHEFLQKVFHTFFIFYLFSYLAYRTCTFIISFFISMIKGWRFGQWNDDLAYSNLYMAPHCHISKTWRYSHSPFFGGRHANQ